MECVTGKPVADNPESPMDEKFMEFQLEKSTEGLSESSVQFMVQTVFFAIFVYIALSSVKFHFNLGMSKDCMARSNSEEGFFC